MQQNRSIISFLNQTASV